MRSRYLLTGIAMAMLGYNLPSPAQITPPATGKQKAPLLNFSPLSGPTLSEAFRGKTMDGIYKVPRQRTGTDKFTERFNEDGTTEYFEGPLVDKGQWIVRGRLICFRYQGALSGTVDCFNVFQSGTCLYSYNPDNIGPDGYPLNDNLWSAKTVTQGDITSCDDLIS